MKSAMLKLVLVAVLVPSLPIYASTVAYWRFEEGPEKNSPVTKPIGALDSSGNA